MHVPIVLFCFVLFCFAMLIFQTLSSQQVWNKYIDEKEKGKKISMTNLFSCLHFSIKLHGDVINENLLQFAELSERAYSRLEDKLLWKDSGFWEMLLEVRLHEL